MSALAHALADLGYRVSGSDRSEGPVLATLRRAGVTAYATHAAEHVDEATAIVYTTAIPAENPELQRARELGKQVFHRSELLAWLMRGKRSVAVTGTHGKTTSSAMVGVILEQAGLDPTVFVGGLVNNWGGNYRLGRGPHMVFKACESDASFRR